MSMTTSEILNAIDSMDLYKKDYDIIVRLLNLNNPSLFTKILEEVLNGNLFWSDFEEILTTSQYSKILESELKNQQELTLMLENLKKLRESLKFPELTNENSDFFILSGNSYTNEFYNKELETIRKELLYELIKPVKTDSILVSACKVRLYNAIRNGELLIKDQKSDNPQYPIYTENAIIDGKNIYEYISPEDIFLFLNSYIIPLDVDSQIITEFDRNFMYNNGLSESEIKKVKALEKLLRYDKIREQIPKEEDNNDVT